MAASISGTVGRMLANFKTPGNKQNNKASSKASKQNCVSHESFKFSNTCVDQILIFHMMN